MIQIILFFLLSAAAILLQGSVLTTPLILGILIAFTVFHKKLWVFFFAFLFGIVLDILSLRPVGLESLYFLLVVLFVFLYERKFETATKEFVGIFSFLAVLGYCLLFPSSGLIIPALLTSVVGVGSFLLFRLFL